MVGSKRGFTIVELLIVIVVIGILAAISVTSYTNVRIEAENAKTATAVKAYLKALRQYEIVHGKYPVPGAMCLGENYPTFTGASAPACRYQSSPISQTANTAARNELKDLMGGTLPMPSDRILRSDTNEYVGAYFYGTSYGLTLDGEPVVGLMYTYEGDKCPVGPSYKSIGYPALSSGNQGVYAAAGPGVRCFLLLPVKA